MIPEEKSEAVSRALRAAFGVSAFEDIQPMTAGLSSALIFRVVVQGRPYLLRVMTGRAMAPGPGQGDPTPQFARMRAAAYASLAPRVLYTSVEDRVSLTDFVDARPFSRIDALVLLPAMLRVLHHLPRVPRTVDYLKAVDGFVARFRAATILPANHTNELFESYASLVSVYPRNDADMVLCHNDLKPENILFDGERAWLVDWEASFLNDRYFDLSMVANFLVTSDADEQALLLAYFGEPAGPYKTARFYLMRQIAHMSYAMAFLQLGSQGKPIDPHAEVPGFRDFHDHIWSGKVSLAGNDRKLTYGRVHFEQLLLNLRTERFHESLRIVSLGC